MVIVNLQETPYDNVADLVIHTDINKVVKVIAAHYDIDIDAFAYRQHYQFICEEAEEGYSCRVESTQVDEQVQCIDEVYLLIGEERIRMNEETYMFKCRVNGDVGSDVVLEVVYKDKWEVDDVQHHVCIEDGYRESFRMKKVVHYDM